jgi:hypothetical protein
VSLQRADELDDRGGLSMKKLALALVSIMSVALGRQVLASPTWSTATTITSVDIEDTADVPPGGNGLPRQFVSFAAAPFSTPCSLGSTGAWRIGGSPDNIKYLLAAASAAKDTGRAVQVLWNSGSQNQCDGGGTSGYPVLIGLRKQ